MHKTIVVIIDRPESTEKINNQIPRNKSLQRFFVFIGQRPSMSELEIIENGDNYLILEDATTLGIEATKIALRAGILYSESNYFVFCSDKSNITTTQAEQIFSKIKQEHISGDTGIILDSDVIGVSREYLLFAGFDELYDKFLTINTTQQITETADFIEVAKAMSGEPVNNQALLAAIGELCELTNVEIHEENNFSILTVLKSHINNYTSENPKIIIYSTPISKAVLKHACNKIPTNGIVLVVTDTPQKMLDIQQPFQLFKSNQGESILCYACQKK